MIAIVRAGAGKTRRMMMLFSTRLRRWILFIVVLPLVGTALQFAGASLAKRNEASRSAAVLSRTGGLMRRRGRRR